MSLSGEVVISFTNFKTDPLIREAAMDNYKELNMSIFRILQHFAALKKHS